MLQFAPHDETRHSRLNYVKLVYGMWLLLSLLSIAQWLAVSFVDSLREIFITYIVVSIFLFMVGIVLLSLFILLPKLRYVKGLGWLVSTLIIECLTTGVSALAARCHYLTMVLYVALSLFLIVMAIVFGSILPVDVTEHVAELFLLSAILLFLSVLPLMLYIVPARDEIIIGCTYFIIHAVLMMLIVMLFAMYVAQLINGWRYAEIRTTDGPLAALLLFCLFLIIFMLTCYTCWPQLDTNEKQTTAIDESWIDNAWSNSGWENMPTDTGSARSADYPEDIEIE